MKQTKQRQVYESPTVEIVEVQTEQCIAASTDSYAATELVIWDSYDLLIEF